MRDRSSESGKLSDHSFSNSLEAEQVRTSKSLNDNVSMNVEKVPSKDDIPMFYANFLIESAEIDDDDRKKEIINIGDSTDSLSSDNDCDSIPSEDSGDEDFDAEFFDTLKETVTVAMETMKLKPSIDFVRKKIRNAHEEEKTQGTTNSLMKYPCEICGKEYLLGEEVLYSVRILTGM